MDESRALAAFAALSNDTRLRILRALVAAGPTGLTAGALAAQVGAAPSRASFHLSNMAEAGLVTSEKSERSVIYRVSFETMGALVQFLLEDCCRNDPQVRQCCGP